MTKGLSYANITREQLRGGGSEMSLINSLKRLRGLSSKQLLVASVFVVALAGAVTLGLATKQKTSAAAWTRDCSRNAIDNQDLNNGCGAADAAEFVADARANNPGDLQAIYARYGLPTSDYDRFVREARDGVALKNGDIVVDGRVVATNAWSIGRDNKPNAWNDGHGYWANTAQTVFRGNEVPVMVLFDENGVMQFYVMKPCGNPGDGNKVKPGFDCKALTKTEVQGEKNTYNFTVDAIASDGATIAKVEYNFGDGKTETKTDLSPVKHKFTAPGNYNVTVKVTFNLPGGKTKVVEGLKCRTTVTVKAPMYECVQLVPSILNNEQTKFRFTVKTKQDADITVKSVDFTLDGKDATKGVTAKDDDGNIYKEYTFADAVKHTVVASVNFNVEDGIKAKTCQASATPKKQPVCEVPGKGHLPPGHPDCVENCTFPGKTHLPKGHPDCGEVLPAELPKTGMGNVLGLFAGTSALGAVAHRVVTSRRNRA